jgi:hypothetical protein
MVPALPDEKRSLMQLLDFFESIEAHPTLEGVGFESAHCGADPTVVVRYVPTGLLTRIGLEALGRNAWPELEAVLTGVREPSVLYHMSRVVGYFSRIENWNVSKIGELHDRQRGNYAIAE